MEASLEVTDPEDEAPPEQSTETVPVTLLGSEESALTMAAALEESEADVGLVEEREKELVVYTAPLRFVKVSV